MSVLSLLAGLGILTEPLHGQTFSPIAGLSFTKLFAGADPLPQHITVTSTGAAFGFAVNISTASGGNWLSVTNAGMTCCYEMPRVLDVAVAPPVDLAAGTYTGQIVLTNSGASRSMTIPVTLTIAPATQPSFDNLPGGISFAMKTGGTAITSQDLQVRGAGTGTLSWTLVKSTADGGDWLTVSAASGTAPSQLSIGVALANLPGNGTVPGTYIGRLLFQTSSGNVTIPVSVVIGTDILSQVNGLSFVKTFAGYDPLPQVFTVSSTGASPGFEVDAWTATGGDWLSVTLDGLTCCYATPRALTVSVKTSPTMAAGSYTAQITIFSSSRKSSITVPVTLTVAAPGSTYFDNLPGQMTFSMKTRATSLTSQELEVRNGTAGTLNWTVKATTADAAPWLLVSPASGTTPNLVDVRVNVAQLPNAGIVAGTFTGQIVFQSATGSVTVPVSVVVGDDALTQQNGIAFTKVFGGANPLPQNITIASIGTNPGFEVDSFTATGGDWLTVSLDGLTCCYATPRVITASVTAQTTLAAGTYTAQIVVQTSGGGMSITIPVTLTVAPATVPFFDNLPGQVTFSLVTSRNSVPGQEIQIRNGGAGTLNWTAAKSTSDGGDWLTMPASSGTAPSVLGLGIDVSKLPGGGLVAGTFVGQVVLKSASSTVTVPVSVTVGSNVLNQINGISFTKTFGGANPLPQIVTVATPGASIGFEVDSSTATGGDWLTVSLDGLTCCYATPRALTVTVKADVTLPAGTYTAQIVVTSSSGASSITVPVTLTVEPANQPFFDTLPGQMSFSMLTTTGIPGTQTLQIRNGGSGSLPWTLSKMTSDNSDWLEVSAISGTAPSTVTVSVNKSKLPSQGLAPGTFTGVLVFRNASGSVSVPVVVTVGASVFVQLAPLTFTKTYGAANPLPQNFNIGSTGASIGFEVDASTGNGGRWLSVALDGLSCCYSSPRAVSASIVADPTLARGTYTGQVVFTSSSALMSMTVPVYLTVVDGPEPPTSPVVITPGSPANSTAITQTFTFTARDVNGATDISRVYFLVDTSTNVPANSCHGFYNRASNSFFLYNDALSATTSPLTPGSAAVIQNSQCAINGAGTAVSTSGNDIVLSLSITRQGPYLSGTKNLYGLAVDSTNRDSGWVALSTWAVSDPPVAPILASPAPNPATANPQTFTLVARDGNGAADINIIYFLVNSSTAIPANTCHGFYLRSSNAIFLYNDATAATVGPLTPGSASTIQNSQCAINGAASSVTQAGTDLTLNLSITRQGSYSNGTKNLYVWIFDNSGQNTGWVTASVWTINSLPVDPELASSSPANSTVAAQTFNLVARDGNGAADINIIYFLVNSNTAIPANTCHGFYLRSSNMIFLYNDATTATVGPLTPGSAATIQNSQCAINGAASSVTQAGTDLTLNLSITRQGSYSTGSKNLYIWIFDNAGRNTGWVTASAWSLGPVVSVTPTTSTTPTQVFTITTPANTNRIYFMVNADTSTPVNSCHGFYDRPSNSLFLYNDALTAVSGPLTPGAGATIQNSNCAINGAGSSVTANGSGVVLNLSITRQGSYASGEKNFYIWTVDNAGGGTGGWLLGSVWKLGGNVAPTLASFAPATATTLTQTLTLTANDGNGAADINRIYFLLNTNTNIPANSCHGFYNRANNSIYLYNDALTSTFGPLTPGASATLQNSNCAINGAASSVTESGNNVVLNLNMTRQGSYSTGTKTFYAWIVDNSNEGTGWVPATVWTIGGPIELAAASPTTATAPTQTFSLTARDGAGFAHISRFYFLVNTNTNIPANSCHGFYDRALNYIYLYNDALTTTIGPLTPGIAGTIQNSNCAINGAASSVTASGTDVVLNLSITRQGSYSSGTKSLYIWLTDIDNAGTGWLPASNWQL